MSQTRVLALSLLTALILAACAPTTVDTSVSVEPPVTVLITAPSGELSELLPRMVATAANLSDLIGSRGKKTESMQEITALWSVARPQISDSEFTDTVDAQVALCQIAVDRNRPADADKCYRNLSALVTSFLE